VKPQHSPATFPRVPLSCAGLLLALLAGAGPARAAADSTYTPIPSFKMPVPFFDSTGHEPRITTTVPVESETEAEWLRAPMGDRLLDHPDPWTAHRGDRFDETKLVLDYNRVDLVRYGIHFQAQQPFTMYPRLGARFEYATGRKRTLWGVQLEQPVLPTARFVFGVSAVRRTEHPELQLVDDVENSLALLFTRTDYRDYYEREGVGAYVAWRVPDFSTVSLHIRGDEYRSLGINRDDVVSWFRLTRPLRDNPAIDDGRTRSVVFRLERLLRRSSGTRAGLYHWGELERAGGDLGGDFDYLRLLGDLRSVLRLSPATTLSLRAVAGSNTDGVLPRQKQFGVGGVDGLRAHGLNARTGNQVALAQAEYTIGLWALRGEGFEGGLHAIAFLDTGTAWDNPRNHWDVTKQRFLSDLGFGLATNEDDVRIYVARDLAANDADWVWSFRLQRPF
jgi:hypothetical protein